MSDYQQVRYHYGPCKGFTLEMPAELAAQAHDLTLRVTDAGKVFDVNSGRIRANVLVLARPEPPRPPQAAGKKPRRKRAVPGRSTA